jgi:hypothetical protein
MPAYSAPRLRVSWARPGADGGCLFMSRIRLIMLSMTSVLLMLVAGAIVSTSSALAEGTPCEKLETKDLVVCVEKPGSKKIEEYENLLGTSDRETFTKPAALKSKLLGLKTRIECKDFKEAFGIVKDSNEGEGKGEFLECKFVEPKTCKLSAAQEKIITAGIKSKFVGGGTHQVKFLPQGTAFVEIELEGCVKETLKVTGSQKCKLVNANTLESLKTVKCETSESELKLGQETAEFEAGFEHIEVLGTKNIDSDSTWDGYLWAEAES